MKASAEDPIAKQNSEMLQKYKSLPKVFLELLVELKWPFRCEERSVAHCEMPCLTSWE